MTMGFGRNHSRPAQGEGGYSLPKVGTTHPAHVSSRSIDTVTTLLDSENKELIYPYFYDTEAGEYVHGKGKVLVATEAITRVVDIQVGLNESSEIDSRDMLDFLIDEGRHPDDA